MEILRKQDLVDVPWKNGGGITRHIANAHSGTTEAWRLSRADVVTEGPFSNFENLTRILTVVSKNTMILEHENGALLAQSLVPVTFDGGLAVHSLLLDGPLTDFNVMFDPDLCDASVSIWRSPKNYEITPPKAGNIAMHILAGRPKLGPHNLAIADTALINAPSLLTLSDEDAVLIVEIRHLDQSKAITSRMASR